MMMEMADRQADRRAEGGRLGVDDRHHTQAPRAIFFYSSFYPRFLTLALLIWMLIWIIVLDFRAKRVNTVEKKIHEIFRAKNH